MLGKTVGFLAVVVPAFGRMGGHYDLDKLLVAVLDLPLGFL